MVMSDRPTAGPLEHSSSLEHQVAEARSAQPAAGHAAVAAAGLRPPRRRPARLHLLRRRFMAGAGLGTTGSAQGPGHGAGAPLGDGLVAGWFRADHRASRRLRLVPRWGARSKADFRVPEVLAQGKGGCWMWQWIPISSATVSFI